MMETTFFSVKIPHDNIKVFSSAVHFLQKMSKDVTIEMEEKSLTLRSLNDAKSAFGAVEFSETFFGSFSLLPGSDSFSCKCLIKPVCLIFRGVKNIRSISIKAMRCDAQHELVFEVALTSGILRSYRFIYVDCEVVSAVFEEGDCSRVEARPKVFSQILQHIHDTTEVSLLVSQDQFRVCSYHKGGLVRQSGEGGVARPHLNTDLQVNVLEFEVFVFRPQGPEPREELVFCLREVLTFLGFCEATNMPTFDFFFQSGGMATKFSVRKVDFCASLVLATIEQPHSQAHQPPTHQQQPPREFTPPDRAAVLEGTSQQARQEPSQHQTEEQPETCTLPLPAESTLLEGSMDVERRLEDTGGRGKKSNVNRKRRFLDAESSQDDG